MLLAGEPGIGKSRLAEELIAHARARGARVLVGRCWEAGGAPAYGPWVQSLRPYLRDTDADSLRSQLREGAADVARLLPELRDRLADLPPAPAIESEGARFRLFDSLAAFLTRAAAAQPLVLVLDDLHAADGPSLLLLRFVTRQLEDSRLVIVGAYRDVDPTLADPLTTTVTELAREPVPRAPGLHDPVRAPRSDPRRAARGRRERRPDRRDDLLQRVRAARRPATERVRCRVQPRPGAHYAAAGIPVADVAGAFQGHVCAWTWFCTIGNLHPNGDGYAAIARAFLAALPAANSARHEAPR